MGLFCKVCLILFGGTENTYLPNSIACTDYLWTTFMPDNTEANINIADALTLMLHNQHALAAAIEEVTVWLTENGVEVVAANAVAALNTLDTNAQGITKAIMRLRQL
jgi:hypothetical protein